MHARVEMCVCVLNLVLGSRVRESEAVLCASTAPNFFFSLNNADILNLMWKYSKIQ